MTDSVRHLQSTQEKMQRIKGEIDRLVYAAEIACHEAGGPCRNPPACRFCGFADDNVCHLGGIRTHIGDHVIQDNIEVG